MSIAGRRELYFGTTVGKVFNFAQGTYTDDGTPITSRIRTKEYYLSGEEQIDEITRIFVYSQEPQGGSISISLDNGDYEVLGSMFEADIPERFDIWKKCYHFSLGVDEVSSSNFKIKGFVVKFVPQTEIR